MRDKLQPRPLYIATGSPAEDARQLNKMAEEYAARGYISLHLGPNRKQRRAAAKRKQRSKP